MKACVLIVNVCRQIARIFTVFVFVLGIPYLLFVGLQLLFGEAGNRVIYLYLLLLLGMLVGFAMAWRKEGVGATIALTTLVGSFILSGGVLPGVGIRQGFSLLVGPLNLLFALLIPGYHLDNSPSAKWVSVISWILPIVAILFFYVSWLIRRRIPESEYDEKIVSTEDERLKKEILVLLTEGLDNLAIADQLHISPVHANLLTATFFEEYGVDNRTDLVARIRENFERKMPQE